MTSSRPPAGVILDCGGVISNMRGDGLLDLLAKPEPGVRAAEAAGRRGVLHHVHRGDDRLAQLEAAGVIPRAA